MRILMFYHSALSDWNHGNAHFLRGVASELTERGHEVTVFEPRDSWSLQNLVAEHGQKPIRKCRAIYPTLRVVRYELERLDPDRMLDGADLVIVHEWNDHALVARLGEHRARSCRPYVLLFHDTHHRMVTAPQTMAAYDLRHYDGVLAYGRVLQDLYERSGRVARAWTWHEAADVRVFKPIEAQAPAGDLVWIGNWGDDERTAELHEFLIEPAQRLKLRTRVHGVRYPAKAKRALARTGIE